MNVIKILSDVEAKKIAAGEVVERPASVVKELVENSVDAGATKISVYIEQAGKKLIRIVDNGCGMLSEDAKLCFANHATSKVRFLDDLQKLNTFGFRGEALASVSSVSKVTLETRYNKGDMQEETGVLIEYADGAVVKEASVACPLGADLRVQDLFYNTPVRQKFLKRDETEWNQIQSLCFAFCLSHLDIHFVLHRDGKMVLNAPPATTVKDRVVQLWGYNLGQNLTPVEDSNGKKVLITGMISRHNFWRYGRQHIFFFVNGRWVKNSELSKALMKGYRDVLPPARFPAAFLFLTLDPSSVDINVHPRKEEVRFVKPATVANEISACVTRTLEGLISQQITAHSPAPLGGTTPFGADQDHAGGVSTARVPGTHLSEVSVPEVPVFQNEDVVLPFALSLSKGCPVGARTAHSHKEHCGAVVQENIIAQNDDKAVESQPVGKIIGQLLNLYIIVENRDGLVLIDQHAAHERILYEKYLKNFEQKDGTRLLFPEVIKLNDSHREMVLDQKDFLEKQGIEVELIGKEEIAIKTSPPKIESQSLRELIFEMIEFIEQNDQLDQEQFRKKLNEHVHGQMACKMAVKKGDVLSHKMMQNILTELQEVDNRFICVHGRPTTWSMSAVELEKIFRRR